MASVVGGRYNRPCRAEQGVLSHCGVDVGGLAVEGECDRPGPGATLKASSQGTLSQGTMGTVEASRAAQGVLWQAAR